MGASASTLSSSTVSGEGRVGKFTVPDVLQRNTLVLSYLFQRLLEKNNLLSYAALMGQDRCGDLQIVLAKQINKEFQTLRFPDPSAPPSLQLVSFIDKSTYEEMQKSGVVEKMCTRISEFLIRFVGLIASLSLSIAIPKGIPEISESSGQDIYRPQTTRFQQTLVPVPSEIWGMLKEQIKLLNAEYIGGDQTTAELMLINRDFFINKNGYMYANKAKSVVLPIEFQYFRYDKDPPSFDLRSTEAATQEERARMERQIEKEKTDFLIRRPNMRDKSEEEIRQAIQAEKQQARYGYQPGFGGPGFGGPMPQAMPVVATAAAASGGGRKTRRKNSHKPRRRQRGAGGIDGPNAGEPASGTPTGTGNAAPPQKSFFKITFKTPGGDMSYVFTDGTQGGGQIGDAYEFATFTESAKSGIAAIQTLQPKYSDGRRTTLLTVIEEVFRITSQSKGSEQEMIRERVTSDPIISITDPGTLKRFSEFLTQKDFYSPAGYRAFLLASRIPIQNVAAVESYLCKDTWALTSLNTKPAYAAFEGLFGIRADSTIEGDERASSEKAQFVERMASYKYVEQKESDRSRREAFQFTTLQFPDNKDARVRSSLAGKCAGSRSPTLLIENKESVAVIMNGYNTLKQMYLGHVKNVYEFLKTVVVVDAEFEQLIQLSSEAASSKPIIRLNETFVRHAVGSHMALNEKIQVARAMIGEHYFQVEKIYNETLDKLNGIV